MSILDQAELWPAIDPCSMRSLVTAFPSQVRAAADMGRNLTLSMRGEVRNVIVTGLGGSAIGGDVIRSAIHEFLNIPFIINRDYCLPGFVGASTLVFACSYSGSTEETLSAYQEAKRAKASIICVASGGQLAALAGADGYPVISLPAGMPPRAALGYSSVAILSAMRALGLVPEIAGSLEETAQLLSLLQERYGPEVPEKDNQAKGIARSLHGRIVSIYASNAFLDAAAARWRGQVEENAKNLAFHHVLPEMNHNELVGWKLPEEILRRIGVVFLRDPGDHPQVQRRFELTQKVIRERAGAVHEIWSEGQSALARIFSVIYLGDFVSLYLAYLNGVDPMPVEVIDSLKRQLSTASAAGGEEPSIGD